MKKIRPFFPFILVLVAFMLLAATTSNQLPSIFKGLVPTGSRVASQGFTKNSSGEGDMKVTMVNVNFTAYKRFNAGHTDFDGEYNFDLNEMAYPEILIQTQGKYYKMAFEKDIESTRKSYANAKSDAITGYDAPKETNYSWGWGITQRVRHKYMGAGSAPDDISYRGQYLGLIIGNSVIKKFKLVVSGAKTPEEADLWAKACAEQIEKTSPNEIQ